MHVISRWINISHSQFLCLSINPSAGLIAAITSDGAILILPLHGGSPIILQMAHTKATSITWTSYGELLIGFSDGLVVLLGVDGKVSTGEVGTRSHLTTAGLR